MEKTFEVRDMRHKEKFQMDDLYLNGYAKKVGVYGTAVYVSLCRHANKQQQSYPSHQKIAEQHNCSRSQVIRAIKLLEKENIIKKVRMGKKLNNRYLLLDKSEWSNSNITCVRQEHHYVSGRNIHSKDTQYKDTHKKESSSLKCTYKPTGESMRFSKGKWWVLPKNGGTWLLWADKEITKVCT